jgi:Alkylmercury lyase
MTVPLDPTIRRHVYETVLTTGLPPLAREAAESLNLDEAEVRESFERLAAGRVLVLQEESREILMAPPFSAVPTPFLVEAAGQRYWGNCIWDALGVLAMLKRDGSVAASCGCCGSSMPLRVEDGTLQPAEGIVHFALPVRWWWEDIVFT